MEWNNLLSKNRLGAKKSSRSIIGRTEFDVDCDRILFSGSFRRLSRKTQVHPLAANDHVHTRLTHSLEVSRVGRTLGRWIGQKISNDLPDGVDHHDLGTLMEAACLAHDLGNPPFGHAGEEAMRHWLDLNSQIHFSNLSAEHCTDIINFEGNAQGFRQLTQTENHLFHGGLRLTFATLGAFLKYPWTSKKGSDKFSVFLSEESILTEVVEELGLKKIKPGEWCRHPLAYLVEAADDICYSVLDLEDAVELKILSYNQVAELMLEYMDKDIRDDLKQHLQPPEMFRVNLTRLRGPIFDLLISGACEGFMKMYEDIMSGVPFTESVLNALPDGHPAKDLVRRAKEAARDDVFSDQKKIEIELGSYSTFETLLDAFCLAGIDQAEFLRGGGDATMSWKSNLVLKLLGDHIPTAKNKPPLNEWTQYQCLRRVLDFVSGMTDNYATYIAQQIKGIGFSGNQRP